MPGASRVGVDSAGGVITGNLAPSILTNGAPAAVLGAEVAAHGGHPHVHAVMAQASPDIFACGKPRCRAGDAASCGHRATGSDNVILNESRWMGDWAVTRARLALASAGAPDDCQKRLPQVVDVMRERGWEEGARLLARWFGAPAGTDREAVPAEPLNMSWVLGFSRAASAHARLMNGAFSPAAIAVLRERLNGHAPGTFDFTTNAAVARGNHHQSEPVESNVLQLPDGLTAALGSFRFYLAARGTLNDDGSIDVAGLSVAIRDGFDFDGDQLLGLWMLDGKVCALSNKSFRTYRESYARGHDIWVESTQHEQHSAHIPAP